MEPRSTGEVKDPGPVTADWIQRNADRRWNDKEKERVKQYLQHKRDMRDEKRSQEWQMQLRQAKLTAMKHGVTL